MSCLTPLTLKNPKRKSDRDFATHKVPCGKCPICVKKRVSQWAFRLEQEQKVSYSSAFLTLTYRDETLPFTKKGAMYRRPTLEKTDLQNFFKRFRKKLDTWSEEKIELKYYAIGEYGTETERPHYHAIVFNIPSFFLSNPLTIKDIWSKGHVRVDPCNPATMAYVTGYLMKKKPTGVYKHFETYYNINTKKHQERLVITNNDPNDFRQKEFAVMSKKMGLNFINDGTVRYLRQHLTGTIVRKGGIKQALPRYFKEKIFTESEREIIKRKNQIYVETNTEELEEKTRLELIQENDRQALKKAKTKRKTL